MNTLLKTDWGAFEQLSLAQRKRYLQFKFLTQIKMEKALRLSSEVPSMSFIRDAETGVN